MFNWLDLSALHCIYFAMVGIGVVYAIIILIGGGLSNIDLPDLDFNVGDVDVGGVSLGDTNVQLDMGGGGVEHGDVGVRPISPVTIASFVTAFGAVGIIGLELLNLPFGWSLLLATAGGLMVGGLVQVAFTVFLIAPQGSSEVRLNDVLGATGEVITPIPAGKMGEVAYVARGTRMTASARSADGSAVGRGIPVKIVRVVGSVVWVEPLHGSPSETPPAA